MSNYRVVYVFFLFLRDILASNLYVMVKCSDELIATIFHYQWMKFYLKIFHVLSLLYFNLIHVFYVNGIFHKKKKKRASRII